MDGSTIAAIATPAGAAGIGIVKISGPKALEIGGLVFRPRHCGSHWTKTHRLSYGTVVTPATGQIVDEVLIGVMRAPRSYTGEDVVEINAHGGPAVLAAILEMALEAGARLAEPGEFTRRALLSGRIDLTQAEAVIDLIQAKTHRQRQNAAAQLAGGLKDRLMAMHGSIKDALVNIAAAIDFPEDVAELDKKALAERLNSDVIGPAKGLCADFRQRRHVREGLRLGIVGRPNVGKSSLMNRLLATDRVIVSPYPGTTRDVVEDSMVINGISLILADTAGLHDSRDPIEALGMARTRSHIEKCDVILVVVDASVGLTQEDRALLARLDGKPVILVFNKIDLIDAGLTAQRCSAGAKYPSAALCAITGQGLDELKARIGGCCRTVEGISSENPVIISLRHKLALDQVVERTAVAVDGLAGGVPLELVAMDLNDALGAVERILGTKASSDLLDDIFGRFCIGK
jgi:tRNA modification GTPase